MRVNNELIDEVLRGPLSILVKDMIWGWAASYAKGRKK